MPKIYRKNQKMRVKKRLTLYSDTQEPIEIQEGNIFTVEYVKHYAQSQSSYYEMYSDILQLTVPIWNDVGHEAVDWHFEPVNG